MSAAAGQPDSGPGQALFSPGRRAACAGAVALVSLLAFETMAVAAAMPAIASALGGLALYALAFGGMLAMSVLGMVLAGRACDRHGALRPTLVGLLVFGGGLLLSGLAPSMGWLVAGRTVQGLGSGMLGVTLYVGMGQLIPSALHPRLFALMAAAWVLPGLVGPVGAAWLVAHWGWRAVFLLALAAVPLAAALLLPALRRLPRPPPQATPVSRAALAWALLAVVGALLLHGAGALAGGGAQAAGGMGDTAGGQSPPWRALQLPALLLLGLLCAGAAARRLLPAGSLVAAPGLPAVMALRGLLAAAFATAEVFIPLALTRLQGWSLTEAGLVLSVGAVFWSAGSALQARITAMPQRRLALQAGLLAVAAGIAAVAAQLLAAGQLVGLGPWLVALGWALAGFGIGLAFPMLSVLTLALSAPEAQGRNASALQLGDALCCSAALAFGGALFNLAAANPVLAHALVLALAAVLALLGALLARRAVV